MSDVVKFRGFDATVIRSNRRRTAVIRVDVKGVSIRVPLSTSNEEAREMIAEKISWVEAKLKDAEEQRQAHSEPRLLAEGATFLLLGKPQEIKLVQGTKAGVEVKQGVASVCTGASGDTSAAAIERTLTKWLRDKAVQQLNFSVNVYAPRVGAVPTNVEVKAYKARWGSCQPDGRLQFNWRLIHAPISILDYVVIHELCHLLEHNHSPAFWRHVERVAGDFKRSRDWLKDNGWRLSL